TSWGVPGFRAFSARLFALAGLAGALRERLFGNRSSARPAKTSRSGRLARLGELFLPWHRLARRGRDQQLPAGNAPHHDWLGSRLQRCLSDSRHPGGRPEPVASGCSGCERAGTVGRGDGTCSLTRASLPKALLTGYDCPVSTITVSVQRFAPESDGK